MSATHDRTDSIRSAPQAQCIACGSAGRELYAGLTDRLAGAPGAWRMAQCPNLECAMLWLDPRPLREDLLKAYATYHTHGAPRPRSRAQLGLSALNATCKLISRAHDLTSGLGRQRRALRAMFLGDMTPGTLLEVGSGAGRFLHRMRRAGWSVRGTDFDPAVAERIRVRYGMSIDVGDLKSLGYPAEAFDAVAMSQVLEHVHDPFEVLAECRRVLRPGGRLVLSTPNARALAHRRFGRAWRGLEPPRHLQIFTRAALARAAEAAGLRVERLLTLSAESAGIYRASEEAREAEGAAPRSSAAMRVVRSWLLRHEEYRQSLRDPEAGEDLFLIASR
jgi:2-polyprenyl-3-methyl-5-hydroxy-6-metoxy-1,4-benzoquinol methylase